MQGLGLGYFYVCALLAIGGALTTIFARNPIRGAMGLMVLILSVAGLFLAMHAQFLATIQLIVYAGAIVVLFLFVIMLLGPSATAPRDHRGRITRTVGGTLYGVGSAVAMWLVIKPAWGTAQAVPPVDSDFGSIDAMGALLFSKGVVPFELSSALLLVAIVGAVAVARGKDQSKTATEGTPKAHVAEKSEAKS
jgi:NADH-quinone oxidoreductase subunit J